MNVLACAYIPLSLMRGKQMISPIASGGFQFPAKPIYPTAALDTTASSVSAADSMTFSGSVSAGRVYNSMGGTLSDSSMAALALLALRDNDEEGGLSPAQKFFLMMLVLGMFNNNFNAGYQSGSLDYTLNVAGGLPLAYTSAAGIIGNIISPGLFVNTVV